MKNNDTNIEDTPYKSLFQNIFKNIENMPKTFQAIK